MILAQTTQPFLGTWQPLLVSAGIAAAAAVYTDWRRWFSNNRALPAEQRLAWDWKVALGSAIEAGGAVLLAGLGVSVLAG